MRTTTLAGLALAAAAGLGSWTVPAMAAVLVNDAFKDNERTQPAAPAYSENGTDSDTDGDLESAWFNSGTGASLTFPTPGAGMLMTVATSSATWTTYFSPNASSVNLPNNGDQLKITWNFRTGNVNASNTSQNFRLAVMNSPDAARVSTDASPGSAAYTGYSLFANMGETTGNGNAFQLRERAVASGDTLGTSGNWTALANGLGNNVGGYQDNTDYTFVTTLTRNGTALDVSMTMTGGTTLGGVNPGTATVSFSDTTPNSFSYNMFQLRPSSSDSTADTFNTTLFRVETLNVPEPATLGVVALGGLAMARRRRV